MFTRFGIYFAPARNSELARFGARWLGWNCQSAEFVPQMKVDGLDVEHLTRNPRKYGFHGTLKAPFELAQNMTFEELDRTAKAFAKCHGSFSLGQFSVQDRGYLTIAPIKQSAELTDFAVDCVKGFEPFRAPLDMSALAKRRAAGLSERQEALLNKWGYPYVLDEFRFHLTLTSRIDAETRARVMPILQEFMGPKLATPLEMQEICIFGERHHGQFEIIRRYALPG